MRVTVAAAAPLLAAASFASASACAPPPPSAASLAFSVPPVVRTLRLAGPSAETTTTTTTAASASGGRRAPPPPHSLGRVRTVDLRRYSSGSSSSSLGSSGGDDEGVVGGGGGGGGGPFGDLRVNPPFAIAHVAFLAYAYSRFASEGTTGASASLLESYFADPPNPEGWNSLFLCVFDYLGLVPALMACLIMPGAAGQSLPAAPFLVGSAAGGYGVLGLYMSAWRDDVGDTSAAVVTKSELGWFTRTVLESKVFNWLALAAAASVPLTAGLIPALLSDPGNVLVGYADQFGTTALVGASSVDLAILSATAAYLIPPDLRRRGMKDEGTANAVAAATLLLPILGGFVYCALRPSLPEE